MATDSLKELPGESLNERLRNLYVRMLSEIPSEDRTTVVTFLENLAASSVADMALKAGDTAPEFTLPDGNGRDVSLSEMLRRGPLVLNFFRGGWSVFCLLELHALQEALSGIRSRGAEVLAISPESSERAVALCTRENLDFPVLTDRDNAVVRRFGIVHGIPESLKSLYRKWGFFLPEFNRTDHWRLPLPATYVVGTDRRIRAAVVEKDPTRRMEVKDILSALDLLSKREPEREED